MSEGPSTRTKRGRTRSIVRATSRAHAGLWWRTPTAWRVMRGFPPAHPERAGASRASPPVRPERAGASRASEASATRAGESKGVAARLLALRLGIALAPFGRSGRSLAQGDRGASSRARGLDELAEAVERARARLPAREADRVVELHGPDERLLGGARALAARAPGGEGEERLGASEDEALPLGEGEEGGAGRDELGGEVPGLRAQLRLPARSGGEDVQERDAGAHRREDPEREDERRATREARRRGNAGGRGLLARLVLGRRNRAVAHRRGGVVGHEPRALERDLDPGVGVRLVDRPQAFRVALVRIDVVAEHEARRHPGEPEEDDHGGRELGAGAALLLEEEAPHRAGNASRAVRAREVVVELAREASLDRAGLPVGRSGAAREPRRERPQVPIVRERRGELEEPRRLRGIARLEETLGVEALDRPERVGDGGRHVRRQVEVARRVARGPRPLEAESRAPLEEEARGDPGQLDLEAERTRRLDAVDLPERERVRRLARGHGRVKPIIIDALEGGRPEEQSLLDAARALLFQGGDDGGLANGGRPGPVEQDVGGEADRGLPRGARGDRAHRRGLARLLVPEGESDAEERGREPRVRERESEDRALRSGARAGARRGHGEDRPLVVGDRGRRDGRSESRQRAEDIGDGGPGRDGGRAEDRDGDGGSDEGASGRRYVAPRARGPREDEAAGERDREAHSARVRAVGGNDLAQRPEDRGHDVPRPEEELGASPPGRDGDEHEEEGDEGRPASGGMAPEERERREVRQRGDLLGALLHAGPLRRPA